MDYNALDHGLVGDGVVNDQPALASLVAKLGAEYRADGCPRIIHCPPGVYSIRDAGTVWCSGVSLIGAGPAATRFELSNPGNPLDPTPLAFFTTREHGASRDNHIADCTFAAFEIDGSGVRLPEYHVLAKGLGLQYVRRGRFRDLYIHDTAASGLGCDFLQDCFVDGVMVVRAGRMNDGTQPGGAGLGIGVGGWGDVERLTIANCTAIDCGVNGIFVELQAAEWTPPRGISITACHTEGNRIGISDWGAGGVMITGCTMIDNREIGFDVSSLGTTGIAGCGGRLMNSVIDGNGGDGISLGDTPGPYTIAGNRISRNAHNGYRHYDVTLDTPATGVVIENNDIWANGHDGIRVDGRLAFATITGNRIFDNGQKPEPPATGAAISVNAATTGLTVRGNRGWNGQDPPTQNHEVRVTARGTTDDARITDNDLPGASPVERG